MYWKVKKFEQSCISDRLSISADISDPLSVIGKSAKFHIGASLVDSVCVYVCLLCVCVVCVCVACCVFVCVHLCVYVCVCVHTQLILTFKILLSLSSILGHFSLPIAIGSFSWFCTCNTHTHTPAYTHTHCHNTHTHTVTHTHAHVQWCMECAPY